MTMHNIVRVLVTVCFTLSAMAVQTAPVKWEISGLTFADGGSGSGYFVFDADTEAVSDWKIDVAGGSTNQLPAIQYNVSNSAAIVGVVANYSDEIQIQFKFPSDRQLRITPVSALTNSGGSIAIDTQTGAGGSGGVECINCNPFRLITGGTLRSDLDNDGVVDVEDAYPADASRFAWAAPTLPVFGLLALVGLPGLFGSRKLRQ